MSELTKEDVAAVLEMHDQFGPELPKEDKDYLESLVNQSASLTEEQEKKFTEVTLRNLVTAAESKDSFQGGELLEVAVESAKEVLSKLEDSNA